MAVVSTTNLGLGEMSRNIRDLLSKPWITPKEAHEAKLFPLCLAGIYKAIKRGEIEADVYGKKVAIRTAPLRKRHNVGSE